MEIDTFEARDGGRWRYVHREEDGTEYWFHGVFHGDQTPDGMLQTFEFDGWPGHVSLEKLTFEEQAGKTVVHTHSVYQTVEARDGMIESGMEEGMNDGFDRLDALLATLREPVA